MKLHFNAINEGLGVESIPPNENILEISGDGTAAIPCGISFPQITEIFSPYCALRFTVTAFPNLHSIRFLRLDPRKSMLSVLPELPLSSLGIGPCSNSTLFDKIPPKKLNHLNLSGGVLRNLEGIGKLAGLTSLRLHNLPRLTDITEIKDLTTLEKVDIVWCTKLENFDAIASLPSLRELTIFGCKGFDKDRYNEILQSKQLKCSFVGKDRNA